MTSLTPTQIREHARVALAQGKITQQEHDYYVQQKLTEIQSQKGEGNPDVFAKTTVGISLAVLLVFVVWAVMTGSPTGLVTFEGVYTDYTQDVLIPLNVTNINSFKLSGTLIGGEFSAKLLVGEQEYLVYEDAITESRITTTYRSYSNNEEIIVVVNATNYTLWLVNEQGNTTSINNTLGDLLPGEYQIDALINDTGNITKESINVTIRQDASAQQNIVRETPSLTFTNKCVDTCVLNTGEENLTLSIHTTGNLTITQISTTQNSAPIQTAQIPTLAVNGSTILDLAPYFSDADNDTLVYDINNIVGVEESMSGSVLTLSGTIAGTYNATLYVSDLYELIQTSFSIVVLAQEANTTTNTTVETNTTINNATNTTQTINTTLENTTTTNNNAQIPEVAQTNSAIFNCNHPNINLRPAECFGTQFDAAFKEILAPIKDKNNKRVGRITRVGNLVIAGDVYENSSMNPGSEDFTLGYSNTDGFSTTFTPTAWIDSITGDLHLAGTLYEEQVTMQPPQYNSYTILNQNSIILVYFNELTGDLYVKGNVVQGGRP